MAEQLLLLEVGEDDWHLDEHTRRVGLKGVAEARRAMAEALTRSRSAGGVKSVAA